MGWKSTTDITREDAILELINEFMKITNKSDKEIEEMLYTFGFGDNPDLKWFGYNFNII